MNASVYLIKPRSDLKQTYISLVEEFLATNEPLVPFTLGYPYQDFDALIKTTRRRLARNRNTSWIRAALHFLVGGR
jgi:hypothetical protein